MRPCIRAGRRRIFGDVSIQLRRTSPPARPHQVIETSSVIMGRLGLRAAAHLTLANGNRAFLDFGDVNCDNSYVIEGVPCVHFVCVANATSPAFTHSTPTGKRGAGGMFPPRPPEGGVKTQKKPPKPPRGGLKPLKKEKKK